MFHIRMDRIKDRNYKDLTDAEEIKKQWQEYTEKLYKKGLNDPDNPDSVLPVDIQDSPRIRHPGVWSQVGLRKHCFHRTNGGDGIPAELFQILKDDVVNVLHSVCQQIWETEQWQQDRKRSVFILVPKKGNAIECSNYPTIARISHASKVMLKILPARLQRYMNWELPDINWI